MASTRARMDWRSGSERGLRGDGDVRPGWGADFPESHFRVAEIRGDSLFLIKDSFLTFLIDREKSFRGGLFSESWVERRPGHTSLSLEYCGFIGRAQAQPENHVLASYLHHTRYPNGAVFHQEARASPAKSLWSGQPGPGRSRHRHRHRQFLRAHFSVTSS